MKIAFDGGGSSWSTPSIRRRNLQPSSNGSRGMSLALFSQRCARDLVDHADDPAVGVRGGRRIEIEDVLVFMTLVALVHIEFFGPFADALGVLIGAVKGVEPGLNDRQRCDDRVDPQAGDELELIHDTHLLGGYESDVQDFVADRQGADQPVRAELLGEKVADLRIDFAGV